MFTSNIRTKLSYVGIGCIVASLIWTRITSGSLYPENIERANMCPHHDFDGYVVSSMYMLWSKTDRGLVNHCAADCYRDQTCLAFFYNRLTLVCQGQSNSSLSIADAVPEDGWVHYRYCLQTDCKDVISYGRDDGIYTLAPSDGLEDIPVFCDMHTDGGGWLVFQRRTDGSVNFTRLWDEYKAGFGFLWNEFWLGNDYIHRLTSQRPCTLRIDMEDFEGSTCVATYKDFELASEDDLYMLTTGQYSGQCGDSFSYGSGRNFTTVDRDNDEYEGNCAYYYPGGWWFGLCHSSNLNGEYNNTNYASGVCWAQWKGYNYSIMFSEMKFRP